MNKKSIIGVTPRLLTEDGSLKEFVNQSYIDAIIKYDANPIMLALDSPVLDEILDLCDGFLITGGSDMDPVYFGETNIEGKSKGIKPKLDIIDKKVVEYAILHKTPMLGICRGHQTINVFLGGSLYQDIGTSHQEITNGHTVKTYPNDILKFDENILTNSYHHQAVNRLGDGFKLIASHTDGTVEAMVHTSLPIICIQWHPEKLLESKESKIIFDKYFEYVHNYKH